MKNFLYLYGPTGAGKTRLLRMMETMLAEQCASGDVIRVGAETLIDELVSELPVQGLDRLRHSV
jgi:chromosomal replication initiation ATPase DnaA